MSMSAFKLYDYDTDREWSDRLNPEVDKIIAPFVIRPATEHEDTKRATDKVSEPKAIAVRIREFKYWLRPDWRGQFTIRLQRRTGAKTEFEKIISGRGDWFFYGFARNDSNGLVGWRLIDLCSFRSHWNTHRNTLRFDDRNNGDGTSFRWFQVSSFPPSPPIQIAACEELSKESPQQLEIPPMFPGWDREMVQNSDWATVTKRNFELAAVDYARKGPRNDDLFRYKGPFTL